MTRFIDGSELSTVRDKINATDTVNLLGFMFSRIDDMFSDIARKLAASPIFEEVDDARYIKTIER